jgi:hypothetical protein
MKELSSIGARMYILAYFFFISFWSHGQVPLTDAPIVQGVDLRGLATFTRNVDKAYPVSGIPNIHVSNKFGAIEITSWDNPLVHVEAVITVGAENRMQAERFAQAIDVTGNHVAQNVEVRTVYPLVQASGNLGYGVNLKLTVPKESKLTVENLFGDVVMKNLSGAVALDVRFGKISLEDIEGELHVRARGEDPLVARNIQNGGTFTLRSTHAEFSRIQGKIQVNNYLGSVMIKEPLEDLELEVSAESGPLHMYIPPDAQPALEAKVDFGSIESDMILPSETWGDSTYARLAQPDSSMKISLYASFENIFIHQDEAPPSAEPINLPGGEPFQQPFTEEISIEGVDNFSLNMLPGNLQLQSRADATNISIKGTRYIRIDDRANAQLALEGLALRKEKMNSHLNVITMLQDDLESLGCSEYRMDLTVQYPESMPIQVVVDKGHTILTNIQGTCSLEQSNGQIEIFDGNGQIQVRLESGDVQLVNTSGDLDITTNQGNITASKPDGKLKLKAIGGKIIVDAPKAALNIENTNGDVRIVSLDGLFGDVEVKAENGNISMAIPHSADALIILNAVGGTIYSALPLDGGTEKDTNSFHGRLNEGRFKIFMETNQGNIVLD